MQPAVSPGAENQQRTDSAGSFAIICEDSL